MTSQFLRWIPIAALSLAVSAFAAPVIDPIPNASVLAGKSLTIPITASSSNGRPLTYTVTSSTNRITVEIHTNNPFWKMSVVQAAPTNAPGAFLTPFRGGAVMVTNVGDMTFLLLRDRAPRTVDAIAALTTSRFYNSNTIFHRIVTAPYYIIQGGDPNTNGQGSSSFIYDDEYHPRSLYTGSGQLGCAKASADANGSQFFITAAPARGFDLRYTIFGQLLRGFNVMSNILFTATNANSRPLADVIITRASLVPNRTDTAITLTGTNFAGVAGTIKVIADDGAGGRTTNSFTATTASDAPVNDPPIIYPDTVTNRVGAMNTRLTNYVSGLDLEGQTYYWFPYFVDLNSYTAASNSLFLVAGSQLQAAIIPATNFTGSVTMNYFLSSDPNWSFYYANFPASYWPPYDVQTHVFVFGDTAITATPTNLLAAPLVPFTNQLLATFTNGLPNSLPANFTAVINWGDDSTSSGSIVTNASGRKEVRGAHTYTNSGEYPIYLSIRSLLGVEARAVSAAIVPPNVTLTRVGTNSAVRWPAWAFDYSLQSLTNLGTTQWMALTNLAGLSGYENVVTNGSSGSNVFFRLKK